MKDKWTNKIHQGDVIEVLKQMPDEFVDTVITSPPYWALRNYDIEGQMGQEAHPQDYINKIVGVCREVKRVLRKSGSFYLNLGDTYCGGGKNKPPQTKKHSYQYGGVQPNCDVELDGKWLQTKQLMLIPSRVAIALQDDGWILRNDIIWHKINPLPNSARDRLSNTFEHVFCFVKSRKYYYDLDAIRVPYKPLDRWSGNLMKVPNKTKVKQGKKVYAVQYRERLMQPNPTGKNPGDVLDICTRPFSEAHFAVFPKKLLEIPIKASCPKWVCKKCGKPRERILEKDQRIQQHWAPGTDKKTEQAKGKHGTTSTLVTGYKFSYKTVGWSDCGCNAEFESGILLDPFAGSGTACLVAKQMGRRYIGIDLNPEYVKMARKRLAKSASIYDWLDTTIFDK